MNTTKATDRIIDGEHLPASKQLVRFKWTLRRDVCLLTLIKRGKPYKKSDWLSWIPVVAGLQEFSSSAPGTVDLTLVLNRVVSLATRMDKYGKGLFLTGHELSGAFNDQERRDKLSLTLSVLKEYLEHTGHHLLGHLKSSQIVSTLKKEHPAILNQIVQESPARNGCSVSSSQRSGSLNLESKAQQKRMKRAGTLAVKSDAPYKRREPVFPLVPNHTRGYFVDNQPQQQQQQQQQQQH
ncbi:hypothetical protein HDU76_003414 [Blyttiomyces sp. JEL0837]|nr:hypothetical protein HDU76_003414 [Blyttiomyces sp. JEL0837]